MWEPLASKNRTERHRNMRVLSAEPCNMCVISCMCEYVCNCIYASITFGENAFELKRFVNFESWP